MKRTVTPVLLGALLFAAVQAVRPVQSQPESPQFFVWMGDGGGSSPEYLDAQFSKLRDAGVDGVMYRCSPDRYPAVIETANRYGLEVHAWQVILNCNDGEVMENHPDWFTVNAKGESSLDHPPFVGYYRWLCPSNEDVQAYLVDRISGLADVEGLRSVHLDYIRHSDVILPVGLWSKYGLVMDREYPEFDFCYCDVCVRQFRDEAGIELSKLEDPSLSPEWEQFRCDSVTRLVNRLANAVHDQGKLLTAAVFPTPSIARSLVRQDWAAWNLDAVYPMAYHSFYEEDVDWIGEVAEEGVRALTGRAPLYCGLYIPSLGPDELVEAVACSIEGGAAGVCLFDAEGMSDEHWDKFAAAVKKYKGSRPVSGPSSASL